MKVVILAGGLGTRIAEETSSRPKPMVEIGGFPILWHIMKIYSSFGFTDFIICCGYKGYVIKEYFSNYFLHSSNVTFDMVSNEITIHDHRAEPWKVTLVDTGEKTQTGGRIKKIRQLLGDEDFCLTYGDGLSNVNIRQLVNFHKKNNKLATVTAVQPPGRFGALEMVGEVVTKFSEKPKGDGMYINGGFFVLNPKSIDLIENDDTVWEQGPIETLANSGQLLAYKHNGFWHPMDTLRDRDYLENLWKGSNPPWRVWN